MKIKLPSLPFWARSPQYRRTINRRLEPKFVKETPTMIVMADGFEPYTSSAELEELYRREHFTPGPCYLPPNAPRPARRWRWERDPAVIGSVIAFVIVSIALYLLGGF